jgi:hypothetical protein
MTEPGKEPVVVVEPDTRPDAGHTVSLEPDRAIRDASLLVVLVPGADAGDASRHPFGYAP